jgi:hypothetical protein
MDKARTALKFNLTRIRKKSATSLKIANMIVHPERFGCSDRKDVALIQSTKAHQDLPFLTDPSQA